jgi:hypothetical protein
MNALTWIGISIQVIPVFFIIKTTLSMIKRKSMF